MGLWVNGLEAHLSYGDPMLMVTTWVSCVWWS